MPPLELLDRAIAFHSTPFLGDGFHPELLPEVRSPEGKPVLAFNLSHLAAGPVINLMMVQRLLPGCDGGEPDAADALAVAICHAHHTAVRRLLGAQA